MVKREVSLPLTVSCGVQSPAEGPSRDAAQCVGQGDRIAQTGQRAGLNGAVRGRSFRPMLVVLMCTTDRHWRRGRAVGRNNRERRAAKQRARMRRERQQSHGDAGAGWDGPPPVELLALSLAHAAHSHARGDVRAAAGCAAELSAGHFGNHPGMVDTAVSMALQRTVGEVWERGWLPYDVVQIVARKLAEPAPALIIDAIAAEFEQYAAAAVHQRWRDQLRQIGATIWWQPSAPHLSQWALRHGLPRGEALTLVITVLAVLVSLPELPRILPLPGQANTDAIGARAGVDQKILARVRGLLAKAESTQFPEEAEALSEKAQELMNRYAFERAIVDAEDHVPQSATSRRLWLDSPYVDGKAHLVHCIASANRCRAVFHKQLGFVSLIGDHTDLEIVELLTTSLLVQATRAMVLAGRQVGRGGQSTTRSYRQSFLLAYAVRIGERLRAATEVPANGATDARLLPVLADRRKVVDELFESMFSETVQKSYRISNSAGWGAGRAAADLAQLGIERGALVESAAHSQ